MGIATTQNNLSVSDAGIDEAKVRMDNARRERDRFEKLLADEAVTPQQYDNVQTAYESAKARYEQLTRAKQSTSLAKSEQTYRLGQNDAVVRLAMAAVDLARLNLSYTVIVAPSDNATGNFVKVEQRVPVRIRLADNDPAGLRRLRAGLNVECEVRY